MHDNRFRFFKLNDLRLHLQRNEANSLKLSNSTIGRILKSKFWMRYKKVNKMHPSVPSMQSTRKMLDAVAIQIIMRDQGVSVIYIDKFKFSWHTSKHYDWAQKRKPGYYTLSPGSFQATFMIAFSAKWIYGVLATNETFNSENFICYLKTIHNYADKEFVVIWDNSKVHVAKHVQEYLYKSKVWAITIPPYWPFINAWEKLILIIKNRVRKNERKGINISLQTFKKMIDEISEDELRSWITESFIYTFRIIQKAQFDE